MNKVPIGPSTIALMLAAVGGAIAFITAWSETGSAPTWLGLVTAGLVAVMGVLRTAQAVQGVKADDFDLTEVESDPPVRSHRRRQVSDASGASHDSLLRGPMRLLMNDQPHELVIVVDEVVIPTRLTIGEKRILGHRVGDKGICFRVQPVRRETPFHVEGGSGRLLLNGYLCPESL